MSQITDVAIIAHDSELAAIGSLSAVLGVTPAQFGCRFELDSGTKAGSFAVWGGAFNYLNWESFSEAVRSAPWRFPSWVTIIRNGESDDDPLRLAISDL